MKEWIEYMICPNCGAKDFEFFVDESGKEITICNHCNHEDDFTCFVPNLNMMPEAIELLKSILNYIDTGKGVFNMEEINSDEYCLTIIKGFLARLNNYRDEQIILQKQIQKSGINVVCCNSCDTVFYYKSKDDIVTCPDCGQTGEPCDFSDLWS